MSRSFRHTCTITTAMLLSSGASLGAQATRNQPPPLTPDIRQSVVDTLGARLRRHYVDGDTAEMIAAHLTTRLRAGAYDSVTSPARFAELLTTDMRAINNDRHLNVSYNPEFPGARPGPEGLRISAPPAYTPAPAQPAGAAVPPGLVAERKRNFALGRIDILPGNIGYMDIRGFSGARDVGEAIRSALEYLQYTDAIIFDLRRNGGGSPFSVNLIISHFTTADTIASLTVKDRSSGDTFTRYTSANVPGPRRPNVPLFVLTSGATASAGEDFTFVLKNMHRATIVGGVTAGAGHNNANLDLGHGFNASISFTRVMDPKTGAEWERVGVIPDVKVDQARALDVAQSLALQAIAANEPDPRRKRQIDLLRETIEAQSNPHKVPAATLAKYAGEYEGGRVVTVQDGRLMFTPREGFPPDALVPLNDTTFALNAVRYSFEQDASRKWRLRGTPPEGESLTYAKLK
jgi:hypothetical protein